MAPCLLARARALTRRGGVVKYAVATFAGPESYRPGLSGWYQLPAASG